MTRRHAGRSARPQGCPPRDPDCVPLRFLPRPLQHKPKRRPRPYKPARQVTSQVIADSDIDSSTVTLTGGVAGRVTLVIAPDQRAAIRRALRRATSALVKLQITAADLTGNTAQPQTLEVRIAL